MVDKDEHGFIRPEFVVIIDKNQFIQKKTDLSRYFQVL